MCSNDEKNSAKSVLLQMKQIIAKFNTLPPSLGPIDLKELSLARDVEEHACLYYIQCNNISA